MKVLPYLPSLPSCRFLFYGHCDIFPPTTETSFLLRRQWHRRKRVLEALTPSKANDAFPASNPSKERNQASFAARVLAESPVEEKPAGKSLFVTS